MRSGTSSAKKGASSAKPQYHEKASAGRPSAAAAPVPAYMSSQYALVPNLPAAGRGGGVRAVVWTRSGEIG